MAITSIAGLLKRTQEIAREQSNVLFDALPHAHELGLGWYPGRLLMQVEIEGRLKDAIPDITGVVLPYYTSPTDLSHLVIAEVDSSMKLNPKKRSILLANRKKGKAKGVFGIHRLLKSSHMTVHVCQDELMATRLSAGITLSHPDRDLAKMVAMNCAKANLSGNSREWYDQFLKLSEGGVHLTINGEPVVEHYHDEIFTMVQDGIHPSAMTVRIQEIMRLLLPSDARQLLAKLEATTKFDFSRLLPGDMRLYRNEREFYEEVAKELLPRYQAFLEKSTTFNVWLGDYCVYQGRANAEELGIFLAADMGYVDMLEWAQDKLKNVPHFYMYRQERLEPRYEVSTRIAQVALNVLMRAAIRKEG